MTPADAIGMLDRELARHGQNIGFHVMTSGEPDAGVMLRAFVRGFKADELVGGVDQQDKKIVLSPSDTLVIPKQGDRVMIGGTQAYNVEAPANVIRMQDVIVRIELQVRG